MTQTQRIGLLTFLSGWVILFQKLIIAGPPDEGLFTALGMIFVLVGSLMFIIGE